MKNQLVADIFHSIAELLEIKGDNPFRIRAYLRAADNVEALKGDIEGLIEQDRLTEIAGIGRDLAEKIKEIAATGKCKHYEELKKTVPQGVVDMLSIPSVGPKTAKLFYDELGIKSCDALKKAAEEGRLLKLPGIKQKTVDNIIKGLDLLKKGQERIDLLLASSVADAFVEGLKKSKTVEDVAAAGSLRRMKETVRDVDILVASREPARAARAFVGLPFVRRVLASGEKKSSVLTKDNVQVDLRVVEPKVFGAALLYFTGSKNHNIHLRSMAVRKGWKINEYGLFDKKGRCLASVTEADMYRSLGLDFIPPEMREDAGEVEAASKHGLPDLLELKDIRGDFHSHTHYSDGQDSIEEMARAARALGYEYICLTDHSVSLKIAHGLDRRRLREKKAELDRVNKKMRGFRVLFGSEAEIGADGRIDYNDNILGEFDIVVGAIHSGFKQSRKQLTSRIIKACKNKHVHIIAHPTGRQWPTREAYDLDLDEIFKAAKDTNTSLEINGNPFRLDLNDVNARRAREEGVRLAIGTDSHAQEHLGFMRFGVGLARRAWLQKEDVLNTHGLEAMMKAIKK